MDATRILRGRQATGQETLDSVQGSAEAESSMAVLLTTTTVMTYPTTAGAFYAANPTEIDGTEVEGGAATYAPGSLLYYALNVGTQIPPVGTLIVAHSVGGRWTFRYDG